jgi:hypothetical protein
MSQTQKLIAELTARAGDPQNPYPYLTGYLTGFIEHLEKTYPQIQQELQKEVRSLEKQKIQKDFDPESLKI